MKDWVQEQFYLIFINERLSARVIYSIIYQ